MQNEPLHRRVFDVLLVKTCLARRAKSQEQLNKLWAAENPLYLPFRMQLLGKQLVYGVGWSFAFPIFYPFVFLFLATSVYVDESGLLRTFRGIITTSDKMYDALLTQVFPAALFLHCVLGFLTAHHRQMEELGLLAVNASNSGLKWHDVTHSTDAIPDTIKDPTVAIELVLLFLSFIFGCAFVFVAKRRRQKRKRARRKAFELETTAVDGEADIPFRELDKRGADPTLYLPELTRTLMAARNARSWKQHLDKPQLRQAADVKVVSDATASEGADVAVVVEAV